MGALSAAGGMRSNADDDGVEDRLQGQGSGNDALEGAGVVAGGINDPGAPPLFFH